MRVVVRSGVEGSVVGVVGRGLIEWPPSIFRPISEPPSGYNTPALNWDRAPRLAPPRRSLPHTARPMCRAHLTCCVHRPASHSWPGLFGLIRWPSLSTPWGGSFLETLLDSRSYPVKRRLLRTSDPGKLLPPPCAVPRQCSPDSPCN